MNAARWTRTVGAAIAVSIASLAGCASEQIETTADAGPEPWTLDTACPRIAQRFCQAMKPCCEESGITPDEDGCVERYVRSACRPFVDLALAGKVSFNLDLYSQEGADALVDHCIDVFSAHFERCQKETVYEFFDLVAELGSGACDIFSGGAEIGAECTQAAECAKAYIPGSWVNCTDGTCRQAALVTQNHSCGWGGTPCAEGLSCDAAYGGEGHCVPTTPPDHHCEADPLNAECGLAGTCDLATSKCKAASKGYDEACDIAGCRSGICFGGRCLHPMRWIEGPQPIEVSLSPEMCRGSELP